MPTPARILPKLLAPAALAAALACATPAAVPVAAAVKTPPPASAPHAAPKPTERITESGPVAVGKPAPAIGGFDVTGKVVLSLEWFRLKPRPAPVLLTFGASFCRPCREGLPRLQAFVARHPEVRLLLVDVEGDQEAAQGFVNEMKLAVALHDKFEVAAKAYGVAAGSSLTLPRTFLIAPDGRVGAIYRTEGADLEAVLEVDLAALVPLPVALLGP